MKAGKCAKLLYTWYGLRTAASSWGAGVLSDLGGGGNCSGDCLEVHILPPRKDDFVIEGGQEDLDWTKAVLANKYLVKVRNILAPEHQDNKVADILTRVVEWHDDELWWEADPRHVEMLEDVGLEDCKPGAVPGTLRAEEQDGELELDWETAWKYRSIVARGNFLAQDRPDIRYTVKELCREMSCPKMRSWAALKKLCRYLRGVPIVGKTSEYLEIFVDSDWAG